MSALWMPYRTPRDPKSRLPLLLERVTVRTPCTASWDEMVGDDTARFCCICSKTVYDLSAMDAADAEAFLARELDGDGSPCARIVRRPDGRILTSECGPGARRRHARRAVAAVAGALTAVTAAGAALHQATLPELAPDDGDTASIYTESPLAQERFATMGAVRFSDDPVERRALSDDDVAITLDEADVRETEVFGTAARTERALAARRRREDKVLPGTIRLVSAHRSGL